MMESKVLLKLTEVIWESKINAAHSRTKALSSIHVRRKTISEGVSLYLEIRLTPHAWCLDVAFKEDNSRICLGHDPENMALIRHIASDLLSLENTARIGKKAQRLKAGWDNNSYLAKVLTG